MGRLENSGGQWGDDVFDSPPEILPLLHFLTPSDLPKTCDNHQGNPGALMLQIREFSTNFKVSENTFKQGEWDTQDQVPWVCLMLQLAQLRGPLTFSLALPLILKTRWSSPEVHLSFHLGFQLRGRVGKSIKNTVAFQWAVPWFERLLKRWIIF